MNRGAEAGIFRASISRRPNSCAAPCMTAEPIPGCGWSVTYDRRSPGMSDDDHSCFQLRKHEGSDRARKMQAIGLVTQDNQGVKGLSIQTFQSRPGD